MAYCELFFPFFWTVKLHCLFSTDNRVIGKLSGLNGELANDNISLCLSIPAVMRLKEPDWLFKRCSPSYRSSREIREPKSSQNQGAF